MMPTDARRKQTALAMRRYRERHPDRVKAATKRETRTYADRKAAGHRGTDKARARDLLQHAVKRGAVEKPSTCQRCGASCNPHGHHSDYSKPYQVEWLCAKCHGTEHRRYA